MLFFLARYLFWCYLKINTVKFNLFVATPWHGPNVPVSDFNAAFHQKSMKRDLVEFLGCHIWTSTPHLWTSAPHLWRSVPHRWTSAPHLWTSAPHLWTSASHFWTSTPRLKIERNVQVCFCPGVETCTECFDHNREIASSFYLFFRCRFTFGPDLATAIFWRECQSFTRWTALRVCSVTVFRFCCSYFCFAKDWMEEVRPTTACILLWIPPTACARWKVQQWCCDEHFLHI